MTDHLVRGPGAQWNTTPAERAATYPCDAFIDGSWQGVVRAIDVDAPAAWVYRWFCQLKVAPYSYDLLDNAGRRSPHHLTPGVDDLAIGQPFLVFTITEFERNRHLSGTGSAQSARLWGPLAVTYLVTARTKRTSRVAVKVNVGTASRWHRLRAALLAVGDLVMMRKQLLTLKHLAESTAPSSAMR